MRYLIPGLLLTFILASASAASAQDGPGGDPRVQTSAAAAHHGTDRHRRPADRAVMGARRGRAAISISRNLTKARSASEPSEIRFLYDDDALYFAGTFSDSDPRGPIVDELKRDFEGRNGDIVSLSLDTFGDYTAYNFNVNGAGVLRDTQSHEDGRVFNANWDACGRRATHRFEGGWTRRGADPVQDHALSRGRGTGLGDERLPADSPQERIHVLVAAAAPVQRLQDFLRRPALRTSATYSPAATCS